MAVNSKSISAVRTRFAPSPTGLLHLGGARTALYCFLFARRHNGQFILRIEDTDRSRYSAEGLKSIFDGLDWLGLKRDEDPVMGGPDAPYTQSERLEDYQAAVQTLVQSGHAYRCFCTPTRLDQMRAEQQANKLPPKYDRRCANIDPAEANRRVSAGESFVIRMRIPDQKMVECVDLIRGTIQFQAEDLDDQVLMKSDGMPTYHLANVVDDHHMRISHVIRGEEWLPSLPKHVLLYQMFGWDTPVFVHLSLFLNPGGGKLSKRQGAMSLDAFREAGYLKEALINFMVLLGWNPKTEREFFTLDELIQAFDLSQINKAGPVFDTEKLDWFNGHYIRQKSPPDLLELCRPYLPKDQTDALLLKIVALEQPRLKKLSDITVRGAPFFVDRLTFEPQLLIWKQLSAATVRQRLQWVLEHLESIPETDYTVAQLDQAIKTAIQSHGLKTGEVLWPLRVALSGLSASPSPFELAWVLEKRRTVERVKDAIALLDRSGLIK